MSEFAGHTPHERGATRTAFARRPRLKGAFLAVGLAAAALSGCQVSDLSTAAHLAPVPAGLERKIDRMGMDVRSPILIRIFKEESVLEVWKEDRAGKYKLLEEYEICAWSGELGPKFKEGDRQAPEGFYTVTRGLMNPNSSYHLAFNLGFPNTFDRSHGRTGSHLMVHGDCSSAGCYAMEDDQIEEIYALAREAFAGGQRAFQVQAFPFRMTPENMARHKDNEHFAFWEMLKEGSDHFEVTKQPPRIDVCDRRYVFNAVANGGSFVPTAACPAYSVRADIARLVADKRANDLEERAKEIERLERRENRDERWEEREAAIAAFFNQSREEQGAGPDTSDLADPGEPVMVSGTPVPRPSPLARERSAGESRGFSFPNPFRRREEPVASTAGVAATGDETPAQTTPVASTAAIAPAEPEQEPEATDVSDEEKPGFFGRVANGTRGLLSGAGNLFN
jgi:murein L,D-transpeptidase YafK